MKSCEKYSFFSTASKVTWAILLLMSIPTSYILWVQKTLLIEWSMMSIMSTPINMTIILDPLGTLFSCTVLFISANVLSFSTIYMKDDKFTDRFTILVMLFILSMNLLIFIPHFMILLIGWDGLGIVSFILVIYYQNSKSLAAGMITALTNRIGDVMLLLSIAWTLNQGHWLITNMWPTSMSMLQISCITLAAMTKSAQMPFSSWLPAAMAAPTPVSALVHSSTLVTAGVFLLIRFYPFLNSFYLFNNMILFIAIITMLMAGISATNECDMKKIIALSTLSQLGMMMTSIGLNMPALAYYHMITHALFKALLFICAGSFINQHMHSQDLRWMGNLTNQMPVATSCITVANMALCGFPFMAGFYSKDLIMESAMNLPNNIFMVLLALLSLGLTSFYSIRFSVVMMWGNQSSSPFISIEEHPAIITPMILLSIMSIISGSLISWLPPMSQYVYILPIYMKLMPMCIIMAGVFIAWRLSIMSFPLKSNLVTCPLNHYASCMMWFLVPMSSQLTMKSPLFSAHYLMKSTDQAWVETTSGYGVHQYLINLNNKANMWILKTPMSYLYTCGFTSLILFFMALSMFM